MPNQLLYQVRSEPTIKHLPDSSVRRVQFPLGSTAVCEGADTSTTNPCAMRVVAQANCCNLMRGESLTSRKKQADALCFPWCIERNGWARFLTAGVKREHTCQDVGTRRHMGLKNPWWKHREGANPSPGTNPKNSQILR